MSQEPTLRYFGWSSFSFESGGGTILFDPLYRKLFGRAWSSLDDFRSAKVICVTHGHFDHYVDVAAVQKQTDAVVVSSHKVCEHLRAKYGVRSQKLIAVEPFQEIDVCGFRITPFEWGHREVRMSTFLRKGVLKAAFLPMIQFAWLNLVSAPFNAPYLGFHVVDSSGMRLTNYCEGFSDAMDIEGIRQLARRLTTDVMIAGAQLNFEEHVAKGVAAMSPRTVVLFHPHEIFFERLGLKSSSAETFASAVRRVLPQTEVIVAKPMSSYTMCARS
jgi:hypothetical protein